MKLSHPTSSALSTSLAAAVCVLAALTLVAPALAGGLYANEMGTPEMGTAGAGGEAAAMDASTAIPFYNPAGMTRLEGNQIIVAGGVLSPTTEFDSAPLTTFSGGDGGQAGLSVPILTAAFVYSFTERFKFGVAGYGLSGAGLEYDSDWVGRKQAQEVEIAALALSPTLAYRVSDWFSIGGGVNIIATSLRMQVEGLLPDSEITIDGTDSEVSYNLSALFEPGETTRIGVTYFSESEFDYAGDVVRDPRDLTAPVNTTLTLAQFVRVGLYQDVSEKAAILLSLGWEDWSALGEQFVTVGELGTASISRNWEDTYRFGVGLHYRLYERWLLRFGVNHDSSPTRAKDRTADLPVDEQMRLGAGFQNERSDRFSWGAELLYADLGDADIASLGVLGNLVGDYKNNNYFGAALNLQWRF
jgi:long-chain fatty acid transport protein